MLVDAAVERRHDPGVAEIDLGDLEVGGGLVNGRLRGVALCPPALDLRLRGGVLLGEALLALVLGSRLGEGCLLLLDRGLGELHVGLVWLGLDHEQKVAFLHDRAVLEVDRPEIAADSGDQVDGVARLRIAGQLDGVGHGFLHGLADRHARRRRRNVGVLLAAAGEQQGDQHRPGQTAVAPHLRAHARNSTRG
jgi:hypothetical protein